jgi:hypothetical protein
MKFLKLHNRFFTKFFIVSTVLCLLATVLFSIKLHERNLYIESFIDYTLSDKNLTTREDTVLTLAKAIYNKTNHGIKSEKLSWYEYVESTFYFNMTSTVALKHGGYGVIGHKVFGPCGTMSRVLANVLWDLDIPARKLQLTKNIEGKGGHTMIEYFDKGSWRVIATSDNAFVWRNQYGEVATADEIRTSPSIFNQIFEQQKNYPYRFDDSRHVNWSKLPAPVVNTIRWLIGEETFSSIGTPAFYDQPRNVFLYTSITLLLCSTLLLISTIKLGKKNNLSKSDSSKLSQHLRSIRTEERERNVSQSSSLPTYLTILEGKATVSQHIN